MGIKPKGTEYVVVPPDNPTTRWGEWEASLDGAGDTAGEVFAETHAIATSAKSTAELAVEDSGKFLTAAANMREEALEGIDPTDPTYALWAAWDLAEQAQDQAATALGEAVLANDQAIRALTRTVANMATIYPGVPYSGDHFMASWSGSTLSITKRDNWVGDVEVLDLETWGTTQTSSSYQNIVSPVIVLYQVKPGIPKSLSITAPPQILPDGVWTTLAEWTAPEDTTATASARFVWSAKTFAGDYEARLMLNGVPATTSEVKQGAPVFGHGPRSHQVAMRLSDVSRYSVLRLEARAAFGNPLNRAVRDVSMDVQWVGTDDTAVVEAVAITGTSGTESRDQFRQELADRGLHYSTVTEIPFTMDTSGATHLGDLFSGCGALTTAPAIDTSAATNIGWMFARCYALTSVPDLQASQATVADGMFYDCPALTDGNVRLIGRNPAVTTTDMITGSGLTRLPFFDAAGNPITEEVYQVSLTDVRGNGTVHPLVSVTVPAGKVWDVQIEGTMISTPTESQYHPQFRIGSSTSATFRTGAVNFSGTVSSTNATIAMVTNHSVSRASFTGTVTIIK